MASIGISSISGIGSGQPSNPILELRKLQERIKTAPALSRNDLATRTRLSAERSGIQSRGSLFSTLQSELGKLNTAARAAQDLRANAKRTEIDGKPATFLTNNASLGISATGAFSSGSFNLSVNQLAAATRSTGSAIASTVTKTGTVTSSTGAAISETVTTDEVLSDGLDVKKTKVDGGVELH